MSRIRVNDLVYFKTPENYEGSIGVVTEITNVVSSKRYEKGTLLFKVTPIDNGMFSVVNSYTVPRKDILEVWFKEETDNEK